MIVAAIIFPILGQMPLSEEEKAMMSYVDSYGEAGSIANMFVGNQNIFIGTYTHLVLLIRGLLPFLDEVVLLRLPGALTVMILTLCLFRFGGSVGRYSSSFLASLLFLSSALMMKLTFRASEVVLPAAFFIFALMSLYHWLYLHSSRRFWLVVFSAALATVFVGATAPISLALMAYVFIMASRQRTSMQFVTITFALLLACFAAFLVIYVIVGDVPAAIAVFDIRQQLSISSNELYPARAFVYYVTIAVFPWLLPLVVSLPWIMRRPGKVYRHFLGLSLLQRYAVIIFLFSLPFFFFDTDLSLVLLIASVFFNMPLMGRLLLIQAGFHHKSWLAAGGAFAVLVAGFLALFVAMANFGLVLHLGARSVALVADVDVWGMVVVVSTALGIYTLWRNARTIGRNNRFLYNLIFLYIASAIIVVGYVAGNLIISA